MYPFYNTMWYPYPYGFNRIKTISGIPVLRTTGVSASATEVRYDINPNEYFMLPKEGLFFLDVRQAAPAGSDALPIALESDEIVPDNTSMLVNALAANVQAGDLKVNIRYMIYYNKCTKTYQLINSYPAPVTASVD